MLHDAFLHAPLTFHHISLDFMRSWAASFSPDPPWLLRVSSCGKQPALYRQRQVQKLGTEPSSTISAQHRQGPKGGGGNAFLFPPLMGAKIQPAEINIGWLDMALLLIFGGIPWQGYFQRVLSAKNEKAAMWLSILAGRLVCLLVAVPSALIGIVGYSANWAAFATAAPHKAAIVLPYALRYLTVLVTGSSETEVVPLIRFSYC
jgi:hypothetical protein